MENSVGLDKLIDERVKQILPKYLKGNAFTTPKVTDTPTEALQVVNRQYVTLNGSVAGRPNSSIAVIGQTYLATDTRIPMTFHPAGWVNGVGSIVAGL